MFKFKTKPRNHQLEEFNLRKDEKIWAWLWEQGTGKTKLGLDNIAHTYFEHSVDGTLIVAPNGVHENWILDEIPKHFCDEIPYMVITWYNKKKKTKKFEKEFQKLLAFQGMSFLAMNFDAWNTKDGQEFGHRFLDARKVFSVADESGVVKNPSAGVSKGCLEISPKSEFVRIMNGTIIEDGPFDCFGQMRFLNENFWERWHIPNLWKFERKFAEFEKKKMMVFDKKTKEYKLRKFDAIAKQSDGKKAYKNLDLLKDMMATCSSRVLKDDVLDLPPKIPMKRYFEMSKNQRLAYETLMKEYGLMIEDDIITADLAITRELKFQQVINGYIATDDGKMIDIPGPNPRLELLSNLIKDKSSSALIWCRFQEDVVKVSRMLKDLKLTYAQYYGPTDDDDRLKAKREFQAGDAQYFVATSAASRGLTLHKAEDEYFYSNSYRLMIRLQMEDRAHRDGLKHSLRIWDLIAKNSIDEKIIQALIDKKEIADYINGDDFKEWL